MSVISSLCVLRQILEAVPNRHGTGRTSAQPVSGELVAARDLRFPQLRLQLLRLLRHGVTLPGHVVGTAGKDDEESNVQGNNRDQRNSRHSILTVPCVRG